MKKFLVLLGLIGVLFSGTCTMAEEVVLITGVNLPNFWKKKGIDQEKVLAVGQKILIDNKIPKRVPIFVLYNNKELNAYSRTYDKCVYIYSSLFSSF